MTATEELLDAVRGRAAALAAGDPDGLRRFLHPAFRWTSHRGERVDREAYIANNTGSELVWLSQSLSEISVAVIDGLGVVTAIVTDTVERDGAAQTFRMPMTQTWIRAAEGWLCVAGHAGPLVP